MEREKRRASQPVTAKLVLYLLLVIFLIALIALAVTRLIVLDYAINSMEHNRTELSAQLEGVKTDYEKLEADLKKEKESIDSSKEIGRHAEQIKTEYYNNIKKLDELSRTNKNVKVAYLTLDDGPSKYTSKFLDILDKNNLLATFFVLGEHVDSFPNDLIRMRDTGHTIANHSYSHDLDKIYQSPQTFMNDIKKTEKKIYAVCGVRTDILRFPGGSTSANRFDQFKGIVKSIDSSGYVYADWNASCGDGKAGYTAQQLYNNTVQAIAGQNNLTILMHDRSEATLGAFPMIIKYLKDKGYTILPLTHDLKMQQYR